MFPIFANFNLALLEENSLEAAHIYVSFVKIPPVML